MADSPLKTRPAASAAFLCSYSHIEAPLSDRKLRSAHPLGELAHGVECLDRWLCGQGIQLRFDSAQPVEDFAVRLQFRFSHVEPGGRGCVASAIWVGFHVAWDFPASDCGSFFCQRGLEHENGRILKVATQDIATQYFAE